MFEDRNIEFNLEGLTCIRCGAEATFYLQGHWGDRHFKGCADCEVELLRSWIHASDPTAYVAVQPLPIREQPLYKIPPTFSPEMYRENMSERKIL